MLAVPDLLLTSVMVWSTIVHFVLAGLFTGHGRVIGVPTILASFIGLALLPGMPLVPWLSFPNTSAYSTTDTLTAIFFWLSGIGAVLISRSSWALIPNRLSGFSLALRNPVHLTATALVLACCFLLATSLRPLIAGELPRLASVSGPLLTRFTR
ncbi:hypothetical protein [Gemmobacter sp. 24YEA27]|uniref:hypothetical protein n=1 Tax=Gemmobacter sp. 24YEA27 TaxID=3040672 RepID=UPI0024B37698|nr:hypothetical protein [Gemmobacter sp. 24YEA27]